jgi:hypothetical protein
MKFRVYQLCGYIFCEFAFKLSDLIDRWFVWDDENNCYEGMLGNVSEYTWLWSYKLGCWFYAESYKAPCK